MKEDYLWDKTGEDAEIERLENALQTFRCQKNVAPALSAKVLPFRKKPSRKIFSFAMAAAACIVFAAFSLIGDSHSAGRIQGKPRSATGRRDDRT